MDDELDLGPSPANEDCVQVGEPDYHARAEEECRRYVALIRKVVGPEPAHARLKVRTNRHEMGDYLSVVVRFQDDDREAVEYAYRCEGNSPTTWGE